MHLIAFIGNPILLFVSDVTMSQEDRETPNVKRREQYGDETEKDENVFDFFKKTENENQWKKFLTPVTEKNMLMYIEIKTRQRAKYRFC